MIACQTLVGAGAEMMLLMLLPLEKFHQLQLSEVKTNREREGGWGIAFSTDGEITRKILGRNLLFQAQLVKCMK
jgi:hypothetical protein